MSQPSHQPLRLMHANPMWAQEFEQTRSSILQATEGWMVDIQHIGSTCMEDGIARPVVDLLAGMEDLSGLNAACELLAGLNYARVVTPTWCAGELVAMMHKPRHGEATHAVLVTRHDGSVWRRALAVRRRLQQNLMDWQNLQNVKRDHYVAGCNALDNYNRAKDEFFAALERQIEIDA